LTQSSNITIPSALKSAIPFDLLNLKAREEDRMKWRGVKMDDEVQQAIVIAFKQLKE
jgi:hypothetical protein